MDPEPGHALDLGVTHFILQAREQKDLFRINFNIKCNNGLPMIVNLFVQCFGPIVVLE